MVRVTKDHDSRGVPYSGDTAARQGWDEEANPYVQGCEDYVCWRTDHRKACDDMWKDWVKK